MVGSGAALGYCWLSVGVVPNVRCQESGGAVELARSGTGMQQDGGGGISSISSSMRLSVGGRFFSGSLGQRI